MVNLLIETVLSGLAITFVLELISFALRQVISKRLIYGVLSVPFSFGALLVFEAASRYMVITVPAVSFISLILYRYLNPPQVVMASPGRHLPRL